MKRWLAIAGLIVLTGTLVFLNQGMKKAAAPDHDEDAPPPQAQTAVKTTPIDSNAILPAEEAVGDAKTASHHIQMGWIYTRNYYQYPESLTVPIQAVRDYVQNSHGAVAAEIVDLDVPLEDRSPDARTVTELGLWADGHSLYDHNPSDAPSSVEEITRGLNGVLGRK